MYGDKTIEQVVEEMLPELIDLLEQTGYETPPESIIECFSDNGVKLLRSVE